MTTLIKQKTRKAGLALQLIAGMQHLSNVRL